MSKHIPLVGKIGNISIPVIIADKAKELNNAWTGRDSDEAVDVELIKVNHDWKEINAVLSPFKLRVKDEQQNRLLLTAGVDMHEDHIDGLTLIWVLRNESKQYFRQGKVKETYKSGDLFLFDDRRRHMVSDAADEKEVFVCWTIGIEFTRS